MKLMMLVATGMMALGTAAFAQDAFAGSAPKILVAFFSKTGNTKSVAEYIHSRVGGDIFHITTKNPYPQDYRETTRIARSELDNNERPELAAAISPEDMKNYDFIFFGYPNWWGTIPMAMFTCLEQYDLSGKTIIPFCTHGGGGQGRGPDDIAKLAQGATLGQGFAVHSGSASRAGNDIDNWLRQLGYFK